jgi:hypothetical protein
VEHGAGVTGRRLRRWWSAWPLAVPAGLVLGGRVLLGEVGSPATRLRAVGGLGDPWADPVAPMLSLLALLAEALAGYLLVVLALRALCVLPGSVGRAARRITFLVTPVVVRRLLDLLVGSTLLAQAALAATPGMPPGHRAAGPDLALATASISSPPTGLVTGSVLGLRGTGPARPDQAVDPAETRPVLRRSAAPLPPWLGGGPSTAPPRSTRRRWPGTPSRSGTPCGTSRPPTSPPTGRTGPNVDRYWRQLYRANRPVVGADPDLIHPGTRLDASSLMGIELPSLRLVGEAHPASLTLTLSGLWTAPR